jgi:hypothetical protein
VVVLGSVAVVVASKVAACVVRCCPCTAFENCAALGRRPGEEPGTVTPFETTATGSLVSFAVFDFGHSQDAYVHAVFGLVPPLAECAWHVVLGSGLLVACWAVHCSGSAVSDVDSAAAAACAWRAVLGSGLLAVCSAVHEFERAVFDLDSVAAEDIATNAKLLLAGRSDVAATHTHARTHTHTHTKAKSVNTNLFLSHMMTTHHRTNANIDRPKAVHTRRTWWSCGVR